MGELQVRVRAEAGVREGRRGACAVWLSCVLIAGCSSGGDDVGATPMGIGSSGVGANTGGIGASGAGAAGVPGTAGTGVGVGAAGMGATAGTSGAMPQPTAGASAGGAGAGAGAGGMGSTAGTGAGTGGMTGSSGAGGGEGGGFMPACMTDPHQAVIVGDSYIDWASHSFPSDLAELAGTTGVWNVRPPTGTMYAIAGTSMATGEIPGQLSNALGDNDDVRIIIMDGGGNDVLLSLAQGCKATGSSTMQVCKDIVADALAASAGMMDEAAAAGVTDIVYFYYPHVPLNTILGGPNPIEILDYALPMARAQCEGTFERSGGKMRCHFVDMIPVFEGKTGYFAAGDLHPSNAGSAAMAAEVWRVMTENCVAQPASSGCCRP
jgi:hypothetical protein